MKVFSIGVLSILSLVLTACGQGTEPISTLGDPSKSLASSLNLPFSNTPVSFTGFSTATADGGGFDFAFATAGVSVVAPAAGLVASVDTSTLSVTLLHNSRVYSRIKGVSASVVVGTYVLAGAQIGTNATGSTVRISVIVDGSYVCPLSFLTNSARTAMLNVPGVSTTNPCL